MFGLHLPDHGTQMAHRNESKPASLVKRQSSPIRRLNDRRPFPLPEIGEVWDGMSAKARAVLLAAGIVVAGGAAITVNNQINYDNQALKTLSGQTTPNQDNQGGPEITASDNAPQNPAPTVPNSK
jgi:hypothetical protein